MPFVALDQVQASRVSWLWAGRLPVGQLAILDGDPGIGKSLVTLDLCARITTGSAFPGAAERAEPSNVVVVNAEDGGDVIAGRLRAAGADLARVQVFERSPGEAFLRLPGHLARLEEEVARSAARYVVLDPITSFLAEGVNLASDQSVRAALAPLADLARRHRCTIQMVRHLNKGGGTNALYRGLYSIGFIASCRVGWLAARDPHVAKQYVLAQPKSNFDPPQASLRYAIEADESGHARIVWRGACHWSDTDLLKGTPNRLRARFRAQEFLVEFLKDGPRTTREIWDAAEKHQISKRTLDRAREKLNITSTRIKSGTPEQTSFWILDGQPITSAISDAPALDEMLKRLNQQNSLRTPLDPPMMR